MGNPPKKYEEQLTELPPPETDYDDFLHVKYDKMDEEDGESEIIFTVDKNSIKPNSIWNYIDKDGFITCMHTLCRINSKGHEYPRDINEEVKEQLEEQFKSHSGQNNYFVKDKSKSHVMFGYIYFYYFVIKMYDFNEEVVQTTINEAIKKTIKQDAPEDVSKLIYEFAQGGRRTRKKKRTNKNSSKKSKKRKTVKKVSRKKYRKNKK